MAKQASQWWEKLGKRNTAGPGHPRQITISWNFDPYNSPGGNIHSAWLGKAGLRRLDAGPGRLDFKAHWRPRNI